MARIGIVPDTRSSRGKLATRKRETRRKMLVGSMVLGLVERGE